MAGIIYELVDVLQEQKECYEGLVTLATYKTEAVVQKNIEVLGQVIEREEAFIGRVQHLDKKRESLLKDISLVSGLPYESLTLTLLIKKMGMDLPVSKTLYALREELIQEMEKLKKQNEINRTIIEQSMEFVVFAINAIKTTQLMDIQTNYQKPGATYEERSRSFYDQVQ